MSFTEVPEANAAPPVDTWMIPSLLLSANPFRTVGRSERGYVDGGVGELSLPRSIKHFAVPGMVGYWHTDLCATTMVTVLENPIERYQYYGREDRSATRIIPSCFEVGCMKNQLVNGT
jgi:hypothetical protein